MLSRPRNAVLCAFAFALAAGYFVTGHYLYQAPIGLDASAFPAGEWIQLLAPGAKHAIAGAVWVVASLVAIAAAAVWIARRGRSGQVDAQRRTFLSRAGSGAGVALGALVLGGASAAARAFLGLGTGTRGWAPIGSQINDRDLPFTHPEWKESWKGSRIANYRRFGRTGWNVSDIVLGTGRIGGEDGERIGRLAIERGVNYFDTSPDYSGAGSEMAMGKAIRSVPRDQIFIASPNSARRSGTCRRARRSRSTSRRSRGACPGSARITSICVTSTRSKRWPGSWTRTSTRRSIASSRRARCASWASPRTRRTWSRW
jgi:hypothetical protein